MLRRLLVAWFAVGSFAGGCTELEDVRGSFGPGVAPSDEQGTQGATGEASVSGGVSDGMTTDGLPSAGTTSGPALTSSTSGASEPTATASASGSTGEPPIVCDVQPPADWGDCLNGGDATCTAASSICLLDDPGAPDFGVCSVIDCVDDCDCPAAPPSGDAPSQCGEILADGGMACHLNCADGETCPMGMDCFNNFLCLWADTPCPGAPPAGAYGDCLALGDAACGNANSLCLGVADTHGVCALEACVNDCDCPAAPATGTAQVRCSAIVKGGGNACYLGCAGGQTCPTGMVCMQDTLCMWPV